VGGETFVRREARGLSRRLVHDPVDDGHDLTDLDLDGVLLRLESPWEPAGDIGVEPHLELAIDDMGWASRRNLRGAAKASSAAEPVVKRHRRIGRAYHRRDEQATGGCDHEIAAPARGNVRSAHRLLLDHSGRFNTPGPFTRVTM